jgi:tetratricopeptide (TPR) repeat protein
VALAFALSYEGLGEEDAEVFRALGAFAPAGFTARAVAGVWGGERREERGEEEVEEGTRKELAALLKGLLGRATVLERAKEGEAEAETVLERLEALSLVRRTEQAGRYDLHPLVRDYAQALAEKAGEREQWAERHARYFLALAGWGRDQLGNPETALAAMATAAAERGNLLAAQEACVGLGMWKEAVGLAYRLDDLFERSGHWADRRRALERGGEAARAGGYEVNQAVLTHNLANLLYQTGEPKKARELLLASLALKRKVGNEALGHPNNSDAATLHQLGMVAQSQGENAEARRLYGEAAETFGELGAQRERAAVLHQLGNVAYLQGDYAEARRLYQESLDIEQQLGNRAGVAPSLHQLGMLAQAQGDYPEARRLYQESLDIKQQLGDRAGVAKTIFQLGRLLEIEGKLDEALGLYRESMQIDVELNNVPDLAIDCETIGRVLAAKGQAAEGRELLEQAVALYERLGLAGKAERVRERLKAGKGG